MKRDTCRVMLDEEKLKVRRMFGLSTCICQATRRGKIHNDAVFARASVEAFL